MHPQGYSYIDEKIYKYTVYVNMRKHCVESPYQALTSHVPTCSQAPFNFTVLKPWSGPALPGCNPATTEHKASLFVAPSCILLDIPVLYLYWMMHGNNQTQRGVNANVPCRMCTIQLGARCICHEIPYTPEKSANDLLLWTTSQRSWSIQQKCFNLGQSGSAFSSFSGSLQMLGSAGSTRHFNW